MTYEIKGPGDYKLRNGAKFVCFEVCDGEAFGKENMCGRWAPHSVNASNGSWLRAPAGDWDVIGPWEEPRKPLELWVNEYDGKIGRTHSKSQEELDKVSGHKRTAVIHLREVERIET